MSITQYSKWVFLALKFTVYSQTTHNTLNYCTQLITSVCRTSVVHGTSCLRSLPICYRAASFDCFPNWLIEKNSKDHNRLVESMCPTTNGHVAKSHFRHFIWIWCHQHTGVSSSYRGRSQGWANPNFVSLRPLHVHDAGCTMHQKLAKCRSVLPNVCLEHASRTHPASRVPNTWDMLLTEVLVCMYGWFHTGSTYT